MKVLFDTNIIIDVLLDRKPFSEHAGIIGLTNVYSRPQAARFSKE